MRFLMELTTRAPQVPNQLPMKLKPRITLLYLIHKVFVKVSKRSVGGMAYRPTSKGSNTITNPLVSPKEKTLWVSKCGAIYWFQCGNLSCDDEYIGETSKTFGERYKEHLKDPLPIHQNSNHTGHPTSHNDFQIIGREGHGLARNIKESIFIRVNNPILNRNIGKLNLPYILDRVLLNTPGLNLKKAYAGNWACQFQHPLPNHPNIPPSLNNANFPSHLLHRI